MKRARRYRTPLTCVMADMDHLKPVNDELGHAVGDRAIAAVAAVIRDELRETDFGARYGGDEFVLLLPHTGGEEGRVLAERICARLRDDGARGRRGGTSRSAPRSASRASREDAPDEAGEALVRAADAALYRAKRAGRGRVGGRDLRRRGADGDEPREHAEARRSLRPSRPRPAPRRARGSPPASPTRSRASAAYRFSLL